MSLIALSNKNNIASLLKTTVTFGYIIYTVYINIKPQQYCLLKVKLYSL